MLRIIFNFVFIGALKETRALNREALYSASKEIEAAAKQRGKPPSSEKKKGKKPAPAPAQKEEPQKAKISKKRKHDATPAKPANDAATAAVPPSTEKPKTKKPKVKAMGAAVAAAVVVPPAVPAEVPAPVSDRKNKKSKKVRVAAANGNAGDVTPIASPVEKTKEEEARRKSVRFSLKRNLVMTIGQPPLPEDVRTPPTSKPKGSALKVKGPGVTRASLLGRSLTSRLGAAAGPAPASVPPKAVTGGRGKGHMTPVGSQSASKAQGKTKNNNNNTPRTLPSPASARRPRASEFF